MLLGIVGYKGRVHLSVTKPIEGDVGGLDELCSQIDRQIVSDLKIYLPTLRLLLDCHYLISLLKDWVLQSRINQTRRYTLCWLIWTQSSRGATIFPLTICEFDKKREDLFPSL